MNNYENIKRVKINEYEILNNDNPYGIADSIHNCIAVIIMRQSSVIIAHFNDHMSNYENVLNEIFNLNDDIIIDATLYYGNDSSRDFIDSLSNEIIGKNVDCQIKKAPYNPTYNESSIGYDFNEKELLVYDVFQFKIRKINESEIEDLNNSK